jgi:CRP-like cAMP-binding protein
VPVRAKRTRNQRTFLTSEKAEEKVSFLTHSDIFRNLNGEELIELERTTTTISCPPGRVIYRPGERGNALFILESGSVQLYHLSTDGRKLIIATLEVGDCFGEMLLFEQETHNSFAEAVENSHIYAINKQDIEHLLTNKPRVTLALLKKMSQRQAQLEAQLINTTFKSMPARLAALLLKLARRQDQETLVVEGLSHEELSERLGVYRETVSTALRELREAGAIEQGRKHITINKPSLLKEIAESDNKGI